MNESIFRMLAAVCLLTGLGISGYFRRKADRDSGERVSSKDEGLVTILVLRLGGLVMWLSTLAYLINPAWLAWSRIGLPEWARWLCVGLCALCDILIYWLFKSIGTGITPTVATRTEHRLTTHGPYRWVRHPLYSIGTLFVASFGGIADSWFIIGMAGLAFILLALRVPNEEAHLIAKFGDAYRDYMKTTGRYLPLLKW